MNQANEKLSAPAGGLLFGILRDSPEFGEFARILKQLTGLSMALNTVDVGTTCNGIPGDTGNPLCSLLRGTAEGARRCEDCDRRQHALAGRTGRPEVYTCHAGFYDLAVPLLIQGRHIATISSGQVLPEPHSAAAFARLRKRLAWMAIPANELRAAYDGAPWLPRERLEHVVRLLEIFARQLCASAWRIRELEARLEHPAIRHGRQFIEAHFADAYLQLADVAAHAGLSPAYFSSLFHRETGLTFTRYIQACRIDEARRLLADSDRSITEIAYACGFGNLTHFNRVFRRGSGCSPSQYRHNPHRWPDGAAALNSLTAEDEARPHGSKGGC